MVSRFSIYSQLNACQLTKVTNYRNAFQLPMIDTPVFLLYAEGDSISVCA